MSLNSWFRHQLERARMESEYRLLCARLRRKANAVALLRVS